MIVSQSKYKEPELATPVRGKTPELMTIKQASNWASQYLHRNVTPSNISYLIQYGRIKKVADNGNTLVNRRDLVNYYESYVGKREIDWISRLGEDLIWTLVYGITQKKMAPATIERTVCN